MESVCRKRESSSEGHLIRIANQLFMLLETVNDTAGLVVVGTSSRPQALDPALRRPGHFDHEVFQQQLISGISNVRIHTT